ncbi:MAG: hypothetical protein IKG26_09150 [Bacillus sp. (in: Bacteria)]|nr:hypothetical protein [Bacillus sp. (in: firmicutes)]
MNYGFNLDYQTPDFVNWATTQQNRIDQRAKERNDAYRNLMQMLGRGVGAYKAYQNYKDWQADQNMWNAELNDLNQYEQDYNAAQDAYDIAAADNLLAPIVNNQFENAHNPYAIPGDPYAQQDDFALYQLGLGGF